MIKKNNFFKPSRFVFILLSLAFSTSAPLYAFELSLTPFGEPTYLGINAGISVIDIGSKQFTAQGQDISIDIDESSTQLSLFFVVPLSQSSGIELSLSQLGSYVFFGEIDGSINVGSMEGEQTYQGLGLNAYYQKNFTRFATRAHAGIVQTRIVTEGFIDLVAKPKQSINDTENSTNFYLSLETNKTIYKDWSLGPAFSYLNSSDPIQIFSLKLSKEIKP